MASETVNGSSIRWTAVWNHWPMIGLNWMSLPRSFVWQILWLNVGGWPNFDIELAVNSIVKRTPLPLIFSVFRQEVQF